MDLYARGDSLGTGNGSILKDPQLGELLPRMIWSLGQVTLGAG